MSQSSPALRMQLQRHFACVPLSFVTPRERARGITILIVSFEFSQSFRGAKLKRGMRGGTEERFEQEWLDLYVSC